MEKVTVKKSVDKAKDIGIVLLALAAGKITADQASARLHPKYGPIAGAVVMGIAALNTKSDRLAWALSIIAAVHAGVALKAFTAGKTGVFSVVNSYTPSLSGFRGMRGLGASGYNDIPINTQSLLAGPYQDETAKLLEGNFYAN